MPPSESSLVPASCSVLRTMIVPRASSTFFMSASRAILFSSVVSLRVESATISFSTAPKFAAFSTSVNP